jgi:hypothetical protein
MQGNSKSGLLENLPCEERIRRGLDDLNAGRRTIDSCLVEIAAPRLRRAKLLPPSVGDSGEPELELYRLLEPEADRAYTRYNALLGELLSFELALDHRLRRAMPPNDSIHPRRPAS